MTKLKGDRDIFGDGRLTIVSTPGHTPGHQSLLVRLPKTGTLLLSGDAVHFKSKWENRGVPVNNTDQDASRASMQKMADLLATVAGLVAEGMTQAQILKAYPDLEAADINEALQYAAEAVRERELPLTVR